MKDILKGTTRLPHDRLKDFASRITEYYYTEVGSTITSNGDFIEGFSIVEEIEALLSDYVIPESMKYFYTKVTFCQEADWHTDSFSYSVMLILKSNGHTVQVINSDACSFESCEVALLRSDIPHCLEASSDYSSFIFVAFDIPSNTENAFKKALGIFKELT
jgi:hypothetical protein